MKGLAATAPIFITTNKSTSSIDFDIYLDQNHLHLMLLNIFIAATNFPPLHEDQAHYHQLIRVSVMENSGS
jgi:ribosomal 30S subunit maturation factor RimM